MQKCNVTKRMKSFTSWLLTAALTLTCVVSFAQSSDQTHSVSPNLPDEQVIAPVDFNALQPGTFVPGELIVGLDPAQPLNLAVTAMGWIGSVSELIPEIGICHIRLVPNLAMADAAEFLRAMPGVRYVEPNAVRRLSARPNDTLFGSQWGLPKIQADLAWDLWRPQRATFIAIVDTGIDHNHPDLRNKIRRHSNGSVYGYNALNNNTNAFDDDPDGHGTHCAGIAAAEINNAMGIAGVASWNPAVPGTNSWVQLMPVKIFDAAGDTSIAAIVRGIRWAADNGAHVISMSFGGPGASQSEREAVDYAWGRGLLLAGAAGNAGEDYREYPAAYQNVIAVAATDANDTLTWFSNYGSWVDIAAPGENILSTLPRNRYDFYDGTSMACPFVAGAAALIWSHAPSLTNAQLRSVLERNVDPYQPFWGPIAPGAGRLNVNRALRAAATPRLVNLALSPNTVSGGDSATGTVSIDRAALPGGFTVQLSSSNPNVARVPASVTIPAGQTSANFTITTTGVNTPTAVTITASAGGESRTAQLTVNPACVTIHSVVLEPTRWHTDDVGRQRALSGRSVRVTVHLSAPAPSNVTIQLRSSNTSIVGNATLTIPAGQTSGSVTLSSQRSSQNVDLRFTASNACSEVRSNTLRLFNTLIKGFRVDPNPVQVGRSTWIIVDIENPAPSGGYNLFFSHNAGNAFRLDEDRTVLPGLTREDFTASARQTHSGFILEVRGANGEVFRREVRITRN